MLATLCVTVVFVLMLMRFFAADVYDIVIVHMTNKWYKRVLDEVGTLQPVIVTSNRLGSPIPFLTRSMPVLQIPSGQYVLDVGVGTASALANNKALLVSKNISVVGLDYEQAYITKAAAVVQKAGLADRVAVICKSVYDEDLHAAADAANNAKGGKGEAKGKGGGGGGKPQLFDAAYFSGSITVMPDPAAALKAMRALLKPTGVVYITQTFQKAPMPLMATVKPLMKYLTTIDFGYLTYEKDLDGLFESAGMQVLKSETIDGSVNTKFQAARLIVAKFK
jgi:ubiquinone/menaquinone biosynthesis C-methylase UbiE